MKTILKTCAALVALSSCDLVDQARLFAFSYEIVPVNSGFVTAVRAGQVDVADLLSPNRCFVTLDLSGTDAPGPLFNSNGRPGMSGYNVFVSFAAPINTETGNPATCGGERSVEEITVTIGAPGTPLDIGDTVDVSGLDILIDGQRFDTVNSNELFQATLKGFDDSGNFPRVTADFEAIGISGTDMVLISGSFSLD